MKKTELALAALSLTGILLYLIPIPGSTALTVFAMLGLSLLYFWLGFALFNNIGGRAIFKKSSYKDVQAVKIIGAIGFGIMLSLLVFGILFKIMMWPGASVMLLLPSMFVTVAAIITGIRMAVSGSLFAKRIFIRAAVFVTLGVVCYMLPFNTFLKIRYRQYPDYIKAAEVAAENPENELLQQKAEEERKKIEHENN